MSSSSDLGNSGAVGKLPGTSFGALPAFTGLAGLFGRGGALLLAG